MNTQTKHRFRLRPYGVRWLVFDSRTGRIVEFCDSKGLAVELAATLNCQLTHSADGWARLAEDLT